MKKIGVLIAVLLLSGLAIPASAQKRVLWRKGETKNPVAELAKAVENGRKLFHNDSLGTNGMTCNSCHLGGGTEEGKMGEKNLPAFDKLGCKFPKYIEMAKRVMTLDQMNNFCIVNSLKGQALVWDDPRL